MSNDGGGKEGAGGAGPPASTEVTTFVQGLLTQMQTRFNKMSDNIIVKIDDMGSRIDDLEKGIGEIIEAAGDDKGNSPRKAAPPGA